jgi:hypothetical protein
LGGRGCLDWKQSGDHNINAVRRWPCVRPLPTVAVGGQSDGKSSLLEALLGFKFNVREVEMG